MKLIVKPYYAVHSDGSPDLFPDYPHRNILTGDWEIESDSETFTKYKSLRLWLQLINRYKKEFNIPDLTWSDEPIRIELALDIKLTIEDYDIWHNPVKGFSIL